MPRILRFEVPSDTSLFTPLQLQPRALMQLTMSGWARWVREYLVSFPRLIHEHQFGVVVAGILIEYDAPLHFEDLSTLNVDVGVRVIKNADLLELKLWYRGEAYQEAARVRLLLRPLKLAGEASMSATPTRVTGKLLEMFQADEIDLSSTPARIVPEVVQQARAAGAPKASGVVPIRLWRHLCEVADQWSFIEVVGFAAAGRESLALAEGGAHPVLRRALTLPLKRVDIELSRPGFIFDALDVQSHAWTVDDKPLFIHELKGDSASLGTIVERF